MRSWVERTHSKTVVGGPSEVVDCGAGRSRLQLAGKKQLADPQTWRIVEQMGKAVRQLADPTAPHSHIDKPGRTAGE